MPTPGRSINRFSVVVITGGSSGIGNALIKAIRRLHPEVVVCNLSRSKPEDFTGADRHHLATDLGDRELLAERAEDVRGILAEAPPGEAMLVNNSGFGDYGRFPDLSGAKQTAMVDLNIRAMVDLTARLLPEIRKRGGAVVNIASTAAFQPTPFLATYGATKAFVLNWSLALNEDLRGTGVRVLAVCPGPTRTRFFEAAGFEKPPLDEGAAGWFSLSAEAVADRTLRALASGRSLTVTGAANKLVAFSGGFLPRRLTARAGAWILRRLRLETGGGGK